MMNNLVILSPEAKQAVAQVKNASDKFEKSVEKLIKLEILKAKGASAEDIEKLLKED